MSNVAQARGQSHARSTAPPSPVGVLCNSKESLPPTTIEVTLRPHTVEAK